MSVTFFQTQWFVNNTKNKILESEKKLEEARIKRLNDILN